MLERIDAAAKRLFVELLSPIFGRPLFWFCVILALQTALILNLLSAGRFDPGMNYSNFLQNWVQVVALAVSDVATVAMAAQQISHHREHRRSLDALHQKIDDLHKKV